MSAFDEKSVGLLNQLGEYTRQTLTSAIDHASANACVTGAGSMFRIHLKRATSAALSRSLPG